MRPSKCFLLIAGILTMWFASAAAQIYDFTTIAGTVTNTGSADGTNSNSRFDHPAGVAVDTGGTLYVVDTVNGTIRKITLVGTNWVTSTIAGLVGSTGGTFGTNNAARFHWPYGVAVDATGALYVADTINNTIRKITPVGTNWVTSTIAGLAGNSGSADGINSDARFHNPYGVAVDSNGNLYVADTINDTVRKIAPVGTNWVTSTIAGSVTNAGSADGTNNDALFHYPVGVAVDSVGDLYVVDHLNSTIRKITPVGANWVTTTIAGLAGNIGSADGMNSTARFHYPYGVAIDTNDNLYVVDSGNSTIRRIAPVGTNWVTSTIAGLALNPGSTDGLNSFARFSQPWGAAVDSGGNLYVADYGNFTIRQGVRQGVPWGTLTITKETAKLNFAKTNSDSCALTATIGLGAGYDLTNKLVTLDIGGAQQSFTLDSKGKGRGVAYTVDNKGHRVSIGTCRLVYTKPRTKPARPGFWTLTATLSKGTWRDLWDAYGLHNANISAKAGAQVTLPVVVLISDAAFANDTKVLKYTASLNKAGTAK